MGTRRRGFTLTETLVAVAIMVIMAAAVLPTMVTSDRRALVQEAAIVLEELGDAITRARYDNQDWPANLRHLTIPITTADANICGDTYNNGRVNNWDGPYFDRMFPVGGLPIGIGTVRDAMGRIVLSGNPQSGGSVSHVLIFIDEVEEEDALELDRIVDGDGGAAGTVRWVAPDASGLTTVTWYRIVKGC